MDKVKRHLEICKGLNDLYARKNKDYGDSFHTTFLEEGLAMARIRLGDKYLRFKTLSKGNTAMVKDESIKDTLLDMANYAIMTVLELEWLDEETKKVQNAITESKTGAHQMTMQEWEELAKDA